MVKHIIFALLPQQYCYLYYTEMWCAASMWAS